MSLDCLFVNPNSSVENYQGLAEEVSAIEPPTWSLLLAESCRAKGYKVAILDCDAQRLSDEKAIQNIYDLAPRLVCFVTYGQNPNSGTTNMVGTIRLANKLKQICPEFRTLSIGSHTSALPSEVKENFCFVSINEGVYTLHDLLELLTSKKYYTDNDLEKVRGLVWTGGADGWGRGFKIMMSNNAQIVPQSRMNIDLPGMAWDLLPYKKDFLDLYRCHVWHNNYDPYTRNPFAALYTSLGCPKRCQHCMINIVNRTSIDNVNAADSAFIRYWSPEWVDKQIGYLTKQGVKNIRISDELFFLNRKHYEPIVDNIIEKGYNINSWTYSRYDTVKSNFLDKFKKAGINWLGIGIESGNRQIREEIDKGKYEDIDIKDVVDRIKNAGIHCGLNFIYGYPNEKLENLQETFDLSVELQGELNNYYAAVALPGSPLYFEAKKNNWELPATLDGYGFLAYNHLPMRTHYLTAAEVLKFRDEAWHKYFESESYLNMIESKFGLVARQNIQEISKIKLKRKILECT